MPNKGAFHYFLLLAQKLETDGSILWISTSLSCEELTQPQCVELFLRMINIIVISENGEKSGWCKAKMGSVKIEGRGSDKEEILDKKLSGLSITEWKLSLPLSPAICQSTVLASTEFLLLHIFSILFQLHISVLSGNGSDNKKWKRKTNLFRFYISIDQKYRICCIYASRV